MELGIVGAGWRAEMWISLINKLQGVHITAVLCRNGARGEELHGRYGVPIVSDAAALCASGCSAVLVCVSKQNNCAVAQEYLSRGLRVLCETPAGMNECERTALLRYGADKLQFAEQFPLQPRFAALKKCLEGGALGACIRSGSPAATAITPPRSRASCWIRAMRCPKYICCACRTTMPKRSGGAPRGRECMRTIGS